MSMAIASLFAGGLFHNGDAPTKTLSQPSTNTAPYTPYTPYTPYSSTPYTPYSSTVDPPADSHADSHADSPADSRTDSRTDPRTDPHAEGTGTGGTRYTCRQWLGQEAPTDCVDEEQCRVHGYLPFSTHRTLSRGLFQTSSVRAKYCALQSGDSCILSHEVGLDIPGIFLWHEERVSVRFLGYPRILSGEEPRNIAMRNTDGAIVHGRETVHVMNRTTLVEYDEFAFTSRTSTAQEVLHDEDAYCVQLLVASVPVACRAWLGP